MNAIEIISDVQLIDLTHRDAQFVRAELIDKIDAAIAAAVQAEREANWKPLEVAAYRLRKVAAYANTLPRKYAAGLSELCAYGDIEAAAIRARNGTHD